MKEDDRKLLEEDGWQIDCESPFELSREDGSRATGLAAEYVLRFLKDYKGDPLCRPHGALAI